MTAEKIQVKSTELSKRRIMVIDDDEFTLAMVESALKEDYDIRLISQGAEALTVAQEYYPNLIVVDLNMPNVDGYEILTQFKLHPFLSSIPILCLSGEKSLDVRKQVREMGAAGFLTKPINKKKFQSDIELLLQGSNMSVGSEDHRRSFFIAYNTHEKEKAIRSQIHEWLNKGEKVLFITLANGANFCTEDEERQVRTENFFYLQFKGSILAKLPYMEDLSPIIYDIEEAVGHKTKDWHIIIDDPDIILNVYDKQNSLGHIFMFSELLDRNFSTIAFFSKKPHYREGQDRMNQLANLMTGNI